MDHLYCVIDQFGFPTQVMVTMSPHESAIPGPDVQDMSDVERNGYWFDGTEWHSVGARPSEWHAIDRLNKTWIGNYEGLKAFIKQRVDEVRTDHGFEPIEYNSSLFDADWNAVKSILMWRTQLALPKGFFWRDSDNADHPANAAFLAGLGEAIARRDYTLRKIAWAKKAEIDALPDDLEMIKAYDLQSGWGQ